jgi:predicted transposase YdaD
VKRGRKGGREEGRQEGRKKGKLAIEAIYRRSFECMKII